MELVAWLNGWSVSLTFALFATLAFVFPTGRLARRALEASRRARARRDLGDRDRLGVLAGADRGCRTAAPASSRSRTRSASCRRSILGIAFRSQLIGMSPVLPLVILASIVAIVGRYAGARDLERLQLRWLVAAFGVDRASRSPSASRSSAVFDPDGDHLLGARRRWPSLLPPIAIGIAVIRYRLYEIDRLISRGVSWAVVSGILARRLRRAPSSLLQTVLGGVTQGQTVAVAGVHARSLPPCSSRSGGASRPPSTTASTAPATTPSGRRPTSPSGCATRSTSTSVSGDIVGVVDAALRPSTIGVWIRRVAPDRPRNDSRTTDRQHEASR